MNNGINFISNTIDARGQSFDNETKKQYLKKSRDLYRIKNELTAALKRLG